MAEDKTPKPPSKPRRRRVGLASLALVVLVAVAAAVAQSRWFSRKVAVRVQKEIAAATGLDVQVGAVGFSFWDFAVHLDEVTVGRRGAVPLAGVARLVVAPSPGDLLRGRVQLHRVSVDGASIDLRLVDRGGGIALENGPTVRSSAEGGGGDPPFRDIDVTDLRLHVHHPRLGEVTLDSVDLDVLQTGDRRFMVGLLASGGDVRSPQLTGPVRRLEARFAYDRKTDDLRVALAHVAVGRFSVHVREGLWSPRAQRVEVDARVEAWVEDALRFVPVTHPDLRGAVAVDLRGWVNVATTDFQAAAVLSVRDLAMHASDSQTGLPLRYNFGDAVQLRAEATRERVVVRDFRARWAGADVTAPTLTLGLRGQFPLEGDLRVQGLDFTQLMKNLTVTPHTIVLWTLTGGLRLRASLDPLRFQFDIPALDATSFAILTNGWDLQPQRAIIRIPRARISARMVIDPVSVQWLDVAASFARSSLTARKVRVRTSADRTGREQDIDVDGVASDHIDLADLGTVLDIPIAGVAQVRARALGGDGDPPVTGTMRVADFRFATLPFGDLETAPGTQWGLHSMRLDAPRVTGRFRQSAYELTRAYLDFTRWTLRTGAHVRSERFQAQDFYRMFHFEGDPVFEPYDGSARVDAQVDYVLGRPGDDRDGVMNVAAALDRGALVAFGEHIDDASVRLSYDWLRRRDGVRGARVDVESFRGTKGGAVIEASGSMAPGARMHFVATARAVPLSSLDTVRASGAPVNGAASLTVSVDGTPDAPRVFGTVSLRELSALGRALGAVDITLSQVPDGPVVREVSGRPPNGRITLDTHLLDDRLHVHTALRIPWVEGTWRDALGVDHRDYSRDWGRAELSAAVRTSAPVDLLPWLPPTVLARVGEGARARASFALTLDRARLDDVAHADGRLVVDSVDLGAAGMRASLGEGVALAACARRGVFWLDDAGARGSCAEVPARHRGGVPSLSSPATPVFDLTRPMLLGPGGVRVWLTGAATVGQRPSDPLRLSGKVRAELDLARAAALVPAMTWGRGQGVLDLDVGWDGEQPDLSGTVHMADASVGLASLPVPISDIDLDVNLRGSVVDITTARMNYGAATIEASGGRLHLERTSLERIQVPLRIRNLLLSSRDGLPDGLEAGADADLSFARGTADEPALLSGEVTVTRGRFTRPIPLSGDLLRRLGSSDGAVGGAQEAAAEAPYDPANDWLRLDVRVNMPTPFRVANNLAEADVRLGTGRPFVITGTNQRYGILGTVEVPRGVVHLNETDFEIRRARVDFDNPERIAPAFDLVAQTDIRRTTDTTVRSQWRVNLHAYGTPERVNLELSAEPSLALEDIVLLLLFRLTRAEMERVGGVNAGQAVGIELLSRSLGLDQVVQGALPFIDEFRPGSTYNYRSGAIEPSLSLGGRITDTLRWSGMTTFAAQPLLQGTLNLRIGRSVAIQVFLNNATNQPSTQVPNAGVDVRWRLLQ